MTAKSARVETYSVQIFFKWHTAWQTKTILEISSATLYLPEVQVFFIAKGALKYPNKVWVFSGCIGGRCHNWRKEKLELFILFTR